MDNAYTADLKLYRPHHLKVSEFMLTDLYTVQKDDIVDLVAELMDWNTIRYTPVEDSKGKLVGLVTARCSCVITFIINIMDVRDNTLSDIMIKEPKTITQDAISWKPWEWVKENKIGCLPVVNGDELVGLISETGIPQDYSKIDWENVAFAYVSLVLFRYNPLSQT